MYGWFGAGQLMIRAGIDSVIEFDLKHCLNRGGELKMIAAILEQPVIEKIQRA
jgi:hypothetical protein